MSWRMLFSILRRQALMPTLVALQVMLACAILSNVLFMAWRKLAPLVAPSGVDQANLILVTGLTPIGNTWSAGTTRTAVTTLRQVPGVASVSAAVGLPLVTGMFTPIALQGPNGVKLGATVFMGKDLVDTLGLKLVAGRDFRADEYADSGHKRGGVTPIIITRALAKQLFTDGHAVGQLLYHPKGGRHSEPGYRVVGVVAHLMRSRIGEAAEGRGDATVLLPERQTIAPFISYAIRVKPGLHAAALAGVRHAFKAYFGSLMPPGTTPQISFYDARASTVFASRRHALYLFAGIVLVVLAVAVMGIMGLTGFWVQRRTRQIGIQRALGAKRADIARHFMAENALIIGIGILAGMVLAYGGHLLLMHYYELDSLPWPYLPAGAVIMLILGQLAVLGPALRAARVPPALATRTL